MRKEVSKSLQQTLHLDGLSSLSISSVAPLFSVAAAGPAMAQAAGVDVPVAIVLIALPFLLAAWIFLSLNQHFPHAGGSYHWARRILGVHYSNFQAWILLMAYFWSIPPIILPAAEYSLNLLGITVTPWHSLLMGGFWVLFSGSVLLLGARMTAWVTQIFLALEVLAVGAMAFWGYSHWGISVSGTESFSWSQVNWPGVAVCMVLGATIVDGWEIDTYAAEEAMKPRSAPGWGGIFGAVAVVAYYLLIWPLLLHQLSLNALSQSSDSLALWTSTMAPAYAPWMRLAVLASTAGSLWLTTFILSRALFAMGRDGTISLWVARLNTRRAPTWAVVIPLGLSLVITSLQLFLPSIRSLFDLLLSAAGFFLVAEFLLDALSMLHFLTRGHARLIYAHHPLSAHHHLGLLIAALVVVLMLSSVEILFLIYGPQYIAPGIDQVVAGLLAMGVGYAAWQKWQRPHQRTFLFSVEETRIS